ncbi:TPP-dependent acetoin dehydrogenase complex, E1 protein subunit beta [Vulcanimicrobium alpinum]|uniref:TPP-dependent acetoin dehydrogenase complex, E1 protein subunit beta n=1 Tax=Vulcanimicrobium alpinum TaxID=3016050 RepID=A0AAN2C9L2_UNVUL|nr:alpha-ketoacid dehydrogenase subunit beta [Vulcanimicrobium alpinum]BDE05727.1 TPP-dependent acetoin dehydrogenase complex, E1 protein subunit beta [Vulcanimicrobium alpinum]
MATMTFSEATLAAMREEMRRDPTVFLMGEDIAKQGGIFGQFKGLPQEFGFDRVRDTPISEAALVGAGVGAALTGCRPVVDMHFADFITCAMDEVVNQAAKLRYMFGEQCRVPMTLRAPDGITKSAGSQHSQALEGWFVHTPGLEVVIPADAEDAKGLLKAAIRSDNPTLYFEHKALFPVKGAVPDDDFVIPLGKAKTMRDGRDVAIVTYGITVGRALEAATMLEADGIDATVINLRTVWPLDYDAIADAAARTHRVVVAHEAVKIGGVGAEIASFIGEACFDDLDGPVVRLGAAHVPVPFAPVLQEAVYPKAPAIADAARRLVRREL